MSDEIYFTLEGGRVDPLDEHARRIRETRREDQQALARHIQDCIHRATRDLIGRHNTAEMRARVGFGVTGEILRSADRGDMYRWAVTSADDIHAMTVIPALCADGQVGVRIDWIGTVLEGYWQR